MKIQNWIVTAAIALAATACGNSSSDSANSGSGQSANACSAEFLADYNQIKTEANALVQTCTSSTNCDFSGFIRACDNFKSRYPRNMSCQAADYAYAETRYTECDKITEMIRKTEKPRDQKPEIRQEKSPVDDMTPIPLPTCQEARTSALARQQLVEKGRIESDRIQNAAQKRMAEINELSGKPDSEKRMEKLAEEMEVLNTQARKLMELVTCAAGRTY